MSAKFTCQFTVNSDDWYDDDGNVADYGTIVASQVDRIANLLRKGHYGGTVRDVNGNKIGSWKLR